MTARQRVVIVGGGAIGSAIACFLAAGGRDFDITVIERDFTYSKASSALSASSIRQQFSSPVNIRMSQYGIEFFRDIGNRLQVDDDRPDIGLVEPGYLYLASAAGEAQLRENHRLQRSQGVDVALLEPEALVARFPWLGADGLALASLGLSGEGWYDGYTVLQAFRRKAVAQGARYLQADACGFDRDSASGRVTGVQVRSGSKVHPIACDVVVDAGGPWAAAIAGWAGIELPVRARRRSVFSFTCPTPLPDCPLVIDTSGIWFRPEGDRFICGFAPPAHLDGDEPPLDVEHEAFDDFVWPALAARVPAFEAVRMRGAWAGYYEMNTFDHNAVLGRHPDCDNLYFAAGFSGHGLQHAPAVGRGLAELIGEGRYVSLDLSDLGFERILEGRPLLERNVI